MGKIFTNKKIWKMLIVAILVIMAVQVMVPLTAVYADTEPEDSAQEGDNLLWAGILMRPILSLLVTIGDGIMNILHSTIMSQDTSLITVEKGDWWEKIGAVIFGILAAIAIAAVILFIGFEIIIPTIAAFSEAAGIALGALETGVGLATIAKAGEGALIVGTIIISNLMPGTFRLPVYSYSPEEIFKGNILLFDVDFFNTLSDNDIMVNYSIYNDTNSSTDENGNTYGADNPDPNIGKSDEDKWEVQSEDITKKKYDEDVKNGNQAYRVNYYYYIDKNGEKIKTSESYPARDLHNVIATWYVTIRNICIVIMLSMLVYIGIRMMLTTLASDKAKYKEMIKDWAIGLCLLFLMHYIMAFSVALVEKLTDVVKTNVNENAIVVRLPEEYDGNLVKAVEELGINSEFYNEDVVNYPTNLMGKIRILLQLKDNAQTGTYIGYVICFIILVTFTVVFTFTYLKRLLYMAFLTLMAPLVAMTYCLDKINDGQAQGFNTWLKEYIFNLLIQPMHLLLYFILVTSAFELSSTNIIYSIVVLGFMIPAEKLLRGMFGFEKAKTPPSLLGAATGASLFMSAIRGLGNKGPRDAGANKRIRTGNKELGDDSSVDSSDDGVEAFLRTAPVPEGEQLAINDGNQVIEEEGQIRDEEQENAIRQQQLTEEFYDTGLPEGEYNNWLVQAHPELIETEHAENPELIEQNEHAQVEAEPRRPRTSERYWSRENLKDRYQRYKRVGRTIAPKAGNLAIRGAKTYLRGSMALGGAIAGGAITLATTGDLGKTTQAVAAGAATGSALASTGIGIASGTHSLSSSVRDSVREVQDAWYGNDAEHKQEKQERQLREFKKNNALRNSLSKAFNEEEMEDMMETGGEVDTYHRYGARNAEDIIAMHKTAKKISEDTGVSIQDAAETTGGIFQLDQDYGNIKDRKKREGAIRNEISSRVNDDRKAEEYTRFAMDKIDLLNDYRLHRG